MEVHISITWQIYDWMIRARRRCDQMSNYFDHLFLLLSLLLLTLSLLYCMYVDCQRFAICKILLSFPDILYTFLRVVSFFWCRPQPDTCKFVHSVFGVANHWHRYSESAVRPDPTSILNMWHLRVPNCNPFYFVWIIRENSKKRTCRKITQFLHNR